MTSILKAVRSLVVAALLGAGLVGGAQGATISIAPASQTIAPGGTADIDIMVALGLNEVVGGFSLLLSFDDTILGGVSYANDPDAKMGPNPNDPVNDFSFGFSGGAGSPLDLLYLADLSFPDAAALGASEGAGFRLATVRFTGLTEGLSDLILGVSPTTGQFLSDFDGLTALATTAVNGSICVRDPANTADPCVRRIPEPATLALGLIGAGMAALVGRRRRDRWTNA